MWSWSVRTRWPIRSRACRWVRSSWPICPTIFQPHCSFRLLDQRGRFPRMVLMLQAEVADRLVAKPGGSDYGVLSVMAQYAADITKSFRVSAQCFRPRPEVASAVVLLRTKEQTRLSQQEEVAFRALVKAAFAHRRKTLVNSLRDEGYELPSCCRDIAAIGDCSDSPGRDVVG